MGEVWLQAKEFNLYFIHGGWCHGITYWFRLGPKDLFGPGLMAINRPLEYCERYRKHLELFGWKIRILSNKTMRE